MYKVVLWGLGDGYNYFTYLRGHEMVEVVAVTDKQGFVYKKVDGIDVIKPEDLVGEKTAEFDYLIVTVDDDRIYKEIVAEATSIGISREKIVPLRIFKIPFFDFEKYVQIKNSNISVVSDNCFAGYLYHKFGMKFLTPTINMFAGNDDYYKFISNLKLNMAKPMVEVENVVEDVYAGMFSYPRGKVGECEWQFNHDIVYDTAAERWNRGVKRFNWDNYLVTMAIRSDEMAYKFEELAIEHKIGFYWKDLGLKSVVYMPEWNNPKVRAKQFYNFSTFVNRAADEALGIRSVNWMKVLLHEENYRRIE